MIQYLNIRKDIFVQAMFEYQKGTCIYSGECTFQIHLNYTHQISLPVKANLQGVGWGVIHLRSRMSEIKPHGLKCQDYTSTKLKWFGTGSWISTCCRFVLSVPRCNILSGKYNNFTAILLPTHLIV